MTSRRPAPRAARPYHLLGMPSATALFAATWLAQRQGYLDGEVTPLGLILGVAAFGVAGARRHARRRAGLRVRRARRQPRRADRRRADPGALGGATSRGGGVGAPTGRTGRSVDEPDREALAPQGVMTSLPRARPLTRCRIASGMSLSGNVRSITGTIRPSSARLVRRSSPEKCSLHTNVVSRCPTNRDRASARSWRSKPPVQRPPSSPPPMTSVPSEASARRSRESEALPARSRIRSYAARAVGEVLAGVVHDVVGADRPDEVDLARAADAGDLGAERLGDLHRVACPRRPTRR